MALFFINGCVDVSFFALHLILGQKLDISGRDDFFFLLFTDIFKGECQLSIGTRKNLANDFSRFWHADRKRLPISEIEYQILVPHAASLFDAKP